MKQTIKLSDWTVELISRDNPQNGADHLEQLITRLRRTAKGVLLVLAFLLALCLTSSAISWRFLCKVILNWTNISKSLVLDLGILVDAVLTLGLVILIVRAARWFQIRKIFFVKRPYDIDLPPELNRLMAQLSLGELTAYTSIGYGEADLNAKKVSDSKLLDRKLAPETFTNRYAPLLLSSQKKSWALFWLTFRKSIAEPIYIERPPKDEEIAAASRGIASETAGNESLIHSEAIGNRHEPDEVPIHQHGEDPCLDKIELSQDQNEGEVRSQEVENPPMTLASPPINVANSEVKQNRVIASTLNSKILIEMDDAEYDLMRQRLEKEAKNQKYPTRGAILNCLNLIDELRKPEYRNLPQAKVALILSASAPNRLQFSVSMTEKMYSGNYESFERFIGRLRLSEMP